MAERNLVREVLDDPFRRVKTRAHSYALYESGLFGNKALTWKNPEEIRESKWSGGVCIRDLRGTDRERKHKAPLPLYDIPIEKLDSEIRRLRSLGIPQEAMTFNQSMPNDMLVFQAEVVRGTKSRLFLTYTTLKKPTRLAFMEEILYAQGLVAKNLLEETLFPASLEEINNCLEFYSTSPNQYSAVVEFSAYSIPVGNIRGRNAVIWEVRNY